MVFNIVNIVIDFEAKKKEPIEIKRDAKTLLASLESLENEKENNNKSYQLEEKTSQVNKFELVHDTLKIVEDEFKDEEESVKEEKEESVKEEKEESVKAEDLSNVKGPVNEEPMILEELMKTSAVKKESLNTDEIENVSLDFVKETMESTVDSKYESMEQESIDSLKSEVKQSIDSHSIPVPSKSKIDEDEDDLFILRSHKRSASTESKGSFAKMAKHSESDIPIAKKSNEEIENSISFNSRSTSNKSDNTDDTVLISHKSSNKLSGNDWMGLLDELYLQRDRIQNMDSSLILEAQMKLLNMMTMLNGALRKE